MSTRQLKTRGAPSDCHQCQKRLRTSEPTMNRPHWIVLESAGSSQEGERWKLHTCKAYEKGRLRIVSPDAAQIGK